MPLLDELGNLTPFGDQIKSFLHPERGYDAASEQLQKYFEDMQRRYNEAQGYVTPYANQGQEQYGTLMGGINSLMHPEDLMSRFVSSYQESPYTKQLLDQNRQRGLEGASSMGLMGSSAAMRNIQQGAGNIANQQREQYIQDLMNSYLKGLGLSGDIYKSGAGAAESLLGGALGMAGNEARMGEAQAGLAFGRQNAPGDLVNNLLKLGIQGAGAYYGGTGGGGFLS